MLNTATHIKAGSKQVPLTPKDIMNDVDLCVWVADAKPGASIVSHRGHLSRDRQMHSEGYPEPVRRKIGEIGNCAWKLGEENWLHLIQRRIGYGCWEYIAVRKAETPKLTPVYRIITSLADQARKASHQKQTASKTIVQDGGTPLATGPPGTI